MFYYNLNWFISFSIKSMLKSKFHRNHYVFSFIFSLRCPRPRRCQHRRRRRKQPSPPLMLTPHLLHHYLTTNGRRHHIHPHHHPPDSILLHLSEPHLRSVGRHHHLHCRHTLVITNCLTHQSKGLPYLIFFFTNHRS